jgi:prevent-host-death family protein
MRTLNVHEAKTRLSEVLKEVEKEGQTFVICRNGKPVAHLVPHRVSDRLSAHPTMSRIRIDYDPIEPLSEDEWPMESS